MYLKVREIFYDTKCDVPECNTIGKFEISLPNTNEKLVLCFFHYFEASLTGLIPLMEKYFGFKRKAKRRPKRRPKKDGSEKLDRFLS